jgi:ATP-dependent Clp protease ATP-binding subunit ClpA
VELPLSDECKRVLARTAEEAERLGGRHQLIGTEHLVLVLLREDKCLAAEILRELGRPGHMFERYTEEARRVIFFARQEASQFGKLQIETEHLLLALLREDKALANRFQHLPSTVESIRKQIEGQTTIGEKQSTPMDLPISHESKRVLAFAAEEAERLGHPHIGTEHLLLGIRREDNCFAAKILHELGGSGAYV